MERGAVPCSSSGKFHARRHALVNVLHLLVAGEKAERAAIGNFEQPRDFVGGARGKRLVAHVRHRPRNVQQRLLVEVEFLRQHHFARGLHAEALLQKIEFAADGERRGRENHRVELIEESLAQDFAHVDRRGREKNSAPAAFVPVDVAFFFAFKQELKFAAHFGGASRQRNHFFRLRRERRKFRLHAFHGGGELVVRFAVAFEERLAFGRAEGEASLAFRKILEECAAAFAHAHQVLAQRRGFDPQHAQQIFRIARQFFEAVARNLAAEIVARHVFDFVRFVEHHGRIFRQDRAEIILANGEVGEK